MWRFYRSVIWSAIREFWTAADQVLTGITVLSFFGILINRKYGEKLVTAWTGISPWWSAIPIFLLVAYRLLRANYEMFAKMQRERDDAIAKISTLPEQRPNVVPVIYGKAEKYDYYGIHLRNAGYDALDVQIPSAPVGSSGYDLTFDERLPQFGERSGIAFIEARLEDKTGTVPGRAGKDLHGIMSIAGVETMEFSILYKDPNFRWYRTKCTIEKTNRVRNGLEVRAIGQELTTAPD